MPYLPINVAYDTLYISGGRGGCGIYHRSVMPGEPIYHRSVLPPPPPLTRRTLVFMKSDQLNNPFLTASMLPHAASQLMNRPPTVDDLLAAISLPASKISAIWSHGARIPRILVLFSCICHFRVPVAGLLVAQRRKIFRQTRASPRPV